MARKGTLLLLQVLGQATSSFRDASLNSSFSTKSKLKDVKLRGQWTSELLQRCIRELETVCGPKDARRLIETHRWLGRILHVP